MSSSTSNFERGLMVALTALFALEAATRIWLLPASKDLSRFSGYPERARALARASPPRVVLIGNSATQEGVDPSALAAELGDRIGRPVTTEMFVADSAYIGTMHWMMDRELWKQNVKPELLVVTFFARQLDDREPLDIGRLARYFTDLSDRAELFRYDLPTFDERVEWAASIPSAAFAARTRIKERVLDLIPGYKRLWRQVNDVAFALEHRSGRATPGYIGLTRLLGRAAEQGVKVVVVAFPSQSEYDIPDGARHVIDEKGARLLDLRHLPLDPSVYRDWVHLNERGRAAYTHLLAERLVELLE